MHEEGQNTAGWQFNPGTDTPAPQSSQTAKPLSWTASEYIAHQKSSGWYVQYALVTVLLAGAIFLVTRDYISLGVVLVIAVGFGFFAGRTPKVLTYSLDNRGVHIGQKLYAYEQFKSFSIIKNGALSSISLLPLKRFMPSIAIYFPPEDEQRIVDFLGALLPHEERQPDAVDRLMQRIRF